MKQRGRKSTAKLAVVQPTERQRPEPPAELSETEAEKWRRVVATKSPDFFDEGTFALLAEYCRLCTTVGRMARQVETFQDDWLLTDEGVKRFKELTGIQDRAQGRLNALARSLRLTNQSRFQPTTAATRSKPGKAAGRIWQSD